MLPVTLNGRWVDAARLPQTEVARRTEISNLWWTRFAWTRHTPLLLGLSVLQDLPDDAMQCNYSSVVAQYAGVTCPRLIGREIEEEFGTFVLTHRRVEAKLLDTVRTFLNRLDNIARAYPRSCGLDPSQRAQLNLWVQSFGRGDEDDRGDDDDRGGDPDPDIPANLHQLAQSYTSHTKYLHGSMVIILPATVRETTTSQRNTNRTKRFFLKGLFSCVS